MTYEQKQQIVLLRKQGLGFSVIAEKLNLQKGNVKTFCWRNGLTDAELNHPQPDVISGFCKQCGKPLTQTGKSRPKEYCDSKCRMKWWNAHRNQLTGKSRISLQCANCGAKFSSYPHEHRKFCSHACFIAYYFYREDAHDDAGKVCQSN